MISSCLHACGSACKFAHAVHATLNYGTHRPPRSSHKFTLLRSLRRAPLGTIGTADSYLSFLRLVPLEFGFVKLVLRPLSPLLLGKLICTSLLSLHQYVLNIHLSKSASASGTREGSWDRLTLSISLSRARFCQLHGATVTYAEMNSDGLRLRTNAVMLRTMYVLGDMLSQLIDLFSSETSVQRSEKDASIMLKHGAALISCS